MTPDDPPPPSRYLTDNERDQLFASLFPSGLGGADVLAELAPLGWEHSELVGAFHPTVEDAYAEHVRLVENLRTMCARREASAVRPIEAPSFDEFAGSWVAPPVDPDRESALLVGLCLWDVLSDNHDLLDAARERCHVGSMRYTAGEIAAFAATHGAAAFEYIDFYMGTLSIAHRVDLTPVYVAIFGRLRRAGFDWAYHFPRLYLVDMRPVREALADDGADEDGVSEYCPSAAFEAEQRAREQHQAIEELAARLDEDCARAIEEARGLPAPAIVRAYRLVYGCCPPGWPPSA